MKKQLRDEWVKALRSGKYRQGINKLYDHSTNSYCCLGVICAATGHEVKPRGISLDAKGKRWIRDALGLGSYRAENSKQRALVKMNDVERLSFKKIANWIEKNVPVEP